MAKRKSNSRPARWADACGQILAVKSKIEDMQSELESAIEDLKGVQEEYQEWMDNLPENLQSTALYEKLSEVCNLDLDVELDFSVLDVFDEADAIDLPRGFGRD